MAGPLSNDESRDQQNAPQHRRRTQQSPQAGAPELRPGLPRARCGAGASGRTFQASSSILFHRHGRALPCHPRSSLSRRSQDVDPGTYPKDAFRFSPGMTTSLVGTARSHRPADGSSPAEIDRAHMHGDSASRSRRTFRRSAAPRTVEGCGPRPSIVNFPRRAATARCPPLATCLPMNGRGPSAAPAQLLVPRSGLRSTPLPHQLARQCPGTSRHITLPDLPRSH